MKQYWYFTAICRVDLEQKQMIAVLSSVVKSESGDAKFPLSNLVPRLQNALYSLGQEASIVGFSVVNQFKIDIYNFLELDERPTIILLNQISL